jgi:hypothetical protein
MVESVAHPGCCVHSMTADINALIEGRYAAWAQNFVSAPHTASPSARARRSAVNLHLTAVFLSRDRSSDGHDFRSYDRNCWSSTTEPWGYAERLLCSAHGPMPSDRLVGRYAVWCHILFVARPGRALRSRFAARKRTTPVFKLTKLDTQSALL